VEHHAGIGVSLGLPSVCVVASPRHNAHPFAAVHESGFGTEPIVDGKWTSILTVWSSTLRSGGAPLKQGGRHRARERASPLDQKISKRIFAREGNGPYLGSYGVSG
jgi:hypothetical protein